MIIATNRSEIEIVPPSPTDQKESWIETLTRTNVGSLQLGPHTLTSVKELGELTGQGASARERMKGLRLAQWDVDAPGLYSLPIVAAWARHTYGTFPDLRTSRARPGPRHAEEKFMTPVLSATFFGAKLHEQEVREALYLPAGDAQSARIHIIEHSPAVTFLAVEGTPMTHGRRKGLGTLLTQLDFEVSQSSITIGYRIPLLTGASKAREQNISKEGWNKRARFGRNTIPEYPASPILRRFNLTPLTLWPADPEAKNNNA